MNVGECNVSCWYGDSCNQKPASHEAFIGAFKACAFQAVLRVSGRAVVYTTMRAWDLGVELMRLPMEGLVDNMILQSMMGFTEVHIAAKDKQWAEARIIALACRLRV